MSEHSDSQLPASQMALLGQDFSSYTHDGNFAVYFKLVQTRQEAEEDIRKDTFYPDFVHQFFVDQERIFGYTKPVLRLFYSASRLKRYVKFDYEDKLTREKDNIEPDNIMDAISPIIEGFEYTQDLNHFITEVESKEEKEFRPPGDLLTTFTRPYKKPTILSRAQIEQLESAGGDDHQANGHSNGASEATTNGKGTTSHKPSSSLPSASTDNKDGDSSSTTKTYEIFHANCETKNFKQFQARMQTLIMWFIESANMVDFEDPRWDFFMVFEKYNPLTAEESNVPPLSTEDRYYFAGYATVYKYFAYPDKTRPRVSQMLLLPPYRRNGLGTALLQTIYDYYKKQPTSLDITAEDPDEEFITMRDFLDCKNCLELPSFQPERLKQGWKPDIAKEAQEKLLLCQRQARKVYEILKLRCVDMNDEEEYKQYRLEIKNRLNIPHQKLKQDCDKVKKQGFELPEELRTRLDNPSYAAAALDENYQELVKQYQHTIEKLNNVQNRLDSRTS